MDNKEWLNDYMSLKQVNPNNPFTVPDGYFDELHQRAMSRAILDGINANAETGFTVPENYFDDLQSNLQSRVTIEAISSTATGFTVPDNYFEEMQVSLQSRINIEQALHHTEGFIIPDGYFEDQQQQITSRIAVEEMLNGQHEGFTVPEHYFDNLQNAIINKTVKQGIQRRGIVRRMITSGAFKYAAAACFVMAVGGTLFFEQFESPVAKHNRSYIHKALSTVPDEDIIDYLQLHMDAADTRGLVEGADQINTNGASAEDLKEYLSTH